MSDRGPADDPVIGKGAGGGSGAIAEELRSAAREAMDVMREGARQKEEELWARYHALTKGRRERKR